MQTAHPNHDDRPGRVAAAIARVRAAEDDGLGRSLKEWLAEYPDLGEELRAYFHQREEGVVTGVFAGPRQLEEPTRDLPPAADDPAGAPTIIKPDAGAEAPSGVLPPGTLFGEYELLCEIARGGMGVVYRARHRRLGRIVALKMILTGRLASADEIRRFRTEAEAAAQLDHPHIVPIYEVGDVGGQHYFTMRLIEGGSLQQSLSERKPPFTSQATVQLMVQVARAVHHAHQRGILHRDLKPGNILLDSRCVAHVTDFGLVKQMDQPHASQEAHTRTGAIIGTPSYMSPEQARAERSLTTASDIYSLGAILYELLTGQPPFRGTNPVETLMQVIEREPPRPRSLNGHLDQDLETICLKCLEKDPGQRYGSAASLADDLERWLRHEPIQARPVGSVERAWRWCRRNPVVALLATAVTVLLVGSVIGLAVANAAITRSRDAAEQAAARERGLRTQEEAQRLRANQLAEEEKKMRTALESTQSLLATAFNNTRAALNKERGMAFANRLSSARMALSINNVALAEQMLDECPTDLRGWEWNYLKRLCHAESMSVMANRGVLHPREELLTTAVGNTIRMQRIPTGETETEMRGHQQTVTYLAWNAAGDRLLSAAGLGTGRTELKLWDWPTGKLVRTIQVPDTVFNVVLSPDGKWLGLVISGRGFADGPAAVHPVEVVFQEIDTGNRYPAARAILDRRRQSWDALLTKSVQQVVFRPDSAEAAIVMGNSVFLWSAVTHKSTTKLEIPESQRQDRLLQCAAYFPNGKALLLSVLTVRPQMPTEQGQAGLMILDLAGTEERRSFAIGGRQVFDLQVTSDGTAAVVAAADRTLRVYQLSDGAELNVLRGHTDPIVTVSIRGRMVATTDRMGMVKVWDLDYRPEATLWRQTAGLTFAPRSSTAARIRLAYPGLVSASEVRDMSTSDVLHETLRTRFANVDQVALSEAGDLLAMVGARGVHRTFRMLPQGLQPPFIGATRPQYSIELWDALRGQRRTILDESPIEVVDLRFDSSGANLLAAFRDKSVRVYAVQTGQLKLRQQWPAADDVWLSPDGQRVLLLRHEGVEPVWVLADLWTGQDQLQLKRAAGGLQPVGKRSSVAFSPDGQRVVACEVETRLRGWRGDTDRHQATVWDTRSGDVVATLKGARAPVTIAPNNRRAASAGGEGDASLQLWDLPSGIPLLQITLPNDRADATLETLQFSGVSGHYLGAVVNASGQGMDAYVLSGTVLPEALRYERQARQLVREAAEECLIRSEIIAEIKALPLDPVVRRVALQMVDSWPEPSLAELVRAAWHRVACLAQHVPPDAERPADWRPPSTNAEYLKRALRWADAAVSLSPNDSLIQLVRGAALFRTGRYAEARDILKPLLAAHRSGPPPLPLLAFLALTEQKLGELDAAQQHAARLFQTWYDQRALRDPIYAALLAEVADAVGIKPLQPEPPRPPRPPGPPRRTQVGPGG